jgi:hypothetical protein
MTSFTLYLYLSNLNIHSKRQERRWFVLINLKVQTGELHTECCRAFFRRFDICPCQWKPEFLTIEMRKFVGSPEMPAAFLDKRRHHSIPNLVPISVVYRLEVIEIPDKQRDGFSRSDVAIDEPLYGAIEGKAIERSSQYFLCRCYRNLLKVLTQRTHFFLAMFHLSEVSHSLLGNQPPCRFQLVLELLLDSPDIIESDHRLYECISLDYESIYVLGERRI